MRYHVYPAGEDTEDSWRSTGDVSHRSLAYYSVVSADYDIGQHGGQPFGQPCGRGCTERPPLMTTRRRRPDAEDSDVLQRLLPSTASDDHFTPSPYITTSSPHRRLVRTSERPLLSDDDVNRDVTALDDVPWCKVPGVSSVDDEHASTDLMTKLETVL